MNIAFTYNVRHVKPDANDPQYLKEAEFDEPSTIEGIIKALQLLGHKVYQVEANKDAYEKLRALKNKIDIVFNIAEGIYGADREAQIPSMLEMLQIPYTGPKPMGYAVGLNKSVAKEILSYYHIPTAKWVTAHNMEELNNKVIDFFPAIVKPLSEGSSKGIFFRNLVNNKKELDKIALELFSTIGGDIIIEQYLTGREFTVAVLGNPPRVLPIIEITFDDLPAGMPKFDHFEAKWVYDDPVRHDPLVCPADLTPELKKKIEDLCLKAFDGLEMEDWARFDVRLDGKGEPNFIEVNCPPGIIPDPKANSRFPRAAIAAGLSYPQLLEEILKSACRHYQMTYSSSKIKNK